jgi:hypothetical protein
MAQAGQGVGKFGRFLENAFAGVAFAEEGAFRMADEFLSGVPKPLKELIDANADALDARVVLSSGRPETLLADYVDRNRDIVLAVFDPSRDPKKPSSPRALGRRIRQIRKNLPVPLVVVGA